MIILARGGLEAILEVDEISAAFEKLSARTSVSPLADPGVKPGRWQVIIDLDGFHTLDDAAPPDVPDDAYLTEAGTGFYVTEDGGSYYQQEAA